MPKSQQSWVRSQNPPTQWNLRGCRWSVVEKPIRKEKNPNKSPPLKNIFLSCIPCKWLLDRALSQGTILHQDTWLRPLFLGVGGKYHSHCNDKKHARTNKKIEENFPHIKGNWKGVGSKSKFLIFLLWGENHLCESPMSETRVCYILYMYIFVMETILICNFQAFKEMIWELDEVGTAA